MKLLPDQKSWTEIGYYPYSLSTRYSNAGLVALQVLSGNRLLVLERSYIEANEEASVRLYLLDLSGHEPVPFTEDLPGVAKEPKKQLLVDFSQLKPELAPGLKKIGNFEGFSIIDQTKDVAGRETYNLLFVSDNNESLRQMSDFLFLSVKLP
jgi:hypothetical protein